MTALLVHDRRTVEGSQTSQVVSCAATNITVAITVVIIIIVTIITIITIISGDQIFATLAISALVVERSGR